ncbi:SWIM zinc finger family protein [Anaerostipes sp. Marseille-Q3525]|uniref:SWIM zinc finger family protein n=1 Tax=Anaerostipes sp. Marseille-Q3525 TaxID=2758418 RepID=UPI001BAA12B2|nr:SWIM zinc finger family protein [Anaerostipes sp. Marseille-Q3525]MBR9962235.1 SWIM zinc finger family protein [Anaerostipes sp. Marseille-Q3525]
MGLIEVASAKSVWRGMEYYENKKVRSWEKSGSETYDGVVAGSDENNYIVHIDKAHPKKSTCNCLFAKGRRVVCKHMIALLFTAEPKAAEDFLQQVEEWEKEEEEREQLHYKELRKYVNSLSKAELQERLYDALVELEDTRNRYW